MFLLCFYLWNNTETVILLHWLHVSDCILCWPFGQYSPFMSYVMFVIVCWLINLLKFNNAATQSGPLAVDASFQFVDVQDLGTIDLLLTNAK